MSKNLALRSANKNKNDEFYTQITDIEKELKHYKKHFKDKVIYCNCDDPRISKFFFYFSYSFKHLGLKKLISTCYKNQDIDLFSLNDKEKAIYLEYDGTANINSIPDLTDIKVNHLNGDGDFRSKECIELLKKADIVVTNPPFSLFREYIAQLIKYDKKFIVMGNMNAITYNEIFSLIKEGKIWLGASRYNGKIEFGIPDNYPLLAAKHRINEKGEKFIRVKGVRWYTNLDYYERYENMILYKKYTPEEYPKYDNYDAINVDKVAEIPCDYSGVMGVPITFMDKYNPNQFEILGLCHTTKYDESIVGIPFLGNKNALPLINNECLYARIFIRNKRLGD